MSEATALLPGATSPYLNAAGFLGYTPGQYPVPEKSLGAFVTPPISYHARKPAADRCLVETPGGFLLHSGLPNEGYAKTLRQYAGKWAGLEMPVWPHLLPQSGYECEKMVRAVEELENIGAVEIEFPADPAPALVEELLQASLGELPVYACVPFLSPWEQWSDLLRLYTVAGVVLSAPRGCVVHHNATVNGRLYGPALFPLLLEKLAAAHELGFPLIAGSGIFSVLQAGQALKAGASAIQVDAWCWQLSAPTSPSRS